MTETGRMHDGNGDQKKAELPQVAAGVNGMKVVRPEPAGFRMLLICSLAGLVGLLAGVVAFALYRLIGLFTNLFFFHRLAADFTSARLNQLGPWVILVPVIGGLVVGIMAKYGSEK